MELVNEIYNHYKDNFKVSLAFGILLIFFFLFIPFSNIYTSSGSMFLDYGFLDTHIFVFALEVLLILLYLMFYSIFVTIVTFSVRKEMSHVKVSYYVREMIKKFSTRIFVFYVLYALIVSFFASLMIIFGQIFITDLNFLYLIVNAIILIFSLLVSFVPQAIVVDENGLKHAIINNFEFIIKNWKAFLTVILISMVLLLLLPIVELAFDYFNYVGRYVTLIVTLVFIVPFIEILKTHFYMLKFELVKKTYTIKKRGQLH